MKEYDKKKRKLASLIADKEKDELKDKKEYASLSKKVTKGATKLKHISEEEGKHKRILQTI